MASTKPAWRRLAAITIAAAVGVVALAACGSDDDEGTVPTYAALAATIEAVAAELGDEDDEHQPPVIVAPLYDGTGFALEVQAEVIAILKPTLDVQFIDDANLALVDDGMAVEGNAILLLLALSDSNKRVATVTGEHWASAEDTREFTSRVSKRRDAWVATVTFS